MQDTFMALNGNGIFISASSTKNEHIIQITRKAKEHADLTNRHALEKENQIISSEIIDLQYFDFLVAPDYCHCSYPVVLSQLLSRPFPYHNLL